MPVGCAQYIRDWMSESRKSCWRSPGVSSCQSSPNLGTRFGMQLLSWRQRHQWCQLFPNMGIVSVCGCYHVVTHHWYRDSFSNKRLKMYGMSNVLIMKVLHADGWRTDGLTFRELLVRYIWGSFATEKFEDYCVACVESASCLFLSRRV